MAKYYTPTKLSENIRETPEGFLICVGVPIARTGEMVYGEGETPLDTDDEGKVLIYRDAQEVFHVDTISSFEGKAVTIKHPEQFVSPDNWSYLAKGIIQNVRKAPQKDEDGEESLLADLLIMDSLAIQLIKNGLREVSCGYEAEYEQTGEGKGKQSRIIGNHLALVEQGRAGESYAINDHKGKSTMNKLAEQMKKLFGKAVDEAVNEKEKEEKSKDAEPKKEEKKDDKAMDQGSYDELVKMVKDLSDKIEGMNKPKDEESEKKKEDPQDEGGEEKKDSEDTDEDKEKESKSKDDDQTESKIEERLKAVEAAVAKLLESKSNDEDGEEESEDGEMPKKTGDSASKKTGLEQTKNSQAFDHGDSKDPMVMTAEKMNELNAAHWARK